LPPQVQAAGLLGPRLSALVAWLKPWADEVAFANALGNHPARIARDRVEAYIRDAVGVMRSYYDEYLKWCDRTHCSPVARADFEAAMVEVEVEVERRRLAARPLQKCSCGRPALRYNTLCEVCLARQEAAREDRARRDRQLAAAQDRFLHRMGQQGWRP
jgi:hypothetical protein